MNDAAVDPVACRVAAVRVDSEVLLLLHLVNHSGGYALHVRANTVWYLVLIVPPLFSSFECSQSFALDRNFVEIRENFASLDLGDARVGSAPHFLIRHLRGDKSEDIRLPRLPYLWFRWSIKRVTWLNESLGGS